MPELKILLFFNFFFLIFQYSSCIIQHDQIFHVESNHHHHESSGSNINYPLIKLIKFELKKLKLETFDSNLDEDEQEYFTKIIIEINDELKNKSIYISVFHDPCWSRQSTNKYNTNNAIRGENGKKQMRIERDYTEDFKLGILICGLDDLIGETLLIIYPIFYAKINLEVDNEVYTEVNNEVVNELDNEADNEGDREVNINGIDTYFSHQGGLHKLIKIDCFLNPEGPRKLIKNKKFIEKGKKLLGKNNFIDNSVINEQHRRAELEGISYINICLKFKNAGKYKIRVLTPLFWREPKMELHFYIKINEENKTKCFSKKFIDYKNQNEIDLLSQLREGIMIHVINDNHDYSDYHTKLEKVDKFNEDEFDDLDNYTYLKPSFKEDFKFVEEENKNKKKRKRNE